MTQAEICLNCKRVNCTGECDLIRPKRKPRPAPRVYTAFGEKGTLKQFAEKYGIAVNALYYRVMEGGLSMEAAIKQGPSRGRSGPVEAFGEVLPLREWARRYGIHFETLWYRIHVRGMTPEAAMLEGNPKERGYGLSVRELAWTAGVSAGTVYYRLRQGWSAEEIVKHYGGRKR